MSPEVTTTNQNQVLVLYMPVIHRGYLSLLDDYKEAPIFILADSVTEQYKPLRKDIRSLPAETISSFLKAKGIGSEVRIADQALLAELNKQQQTVVMPNDEQLKQLAQDYLPDADITFLDVFLRWDSQKALSQQKLDAFKHTSSDATDLKFMQLALDQAEKSIDQWRQVGAVLVKDGDVVLQAYNHHLPDDYQPVYAGDPRGNFSKGKHIDISTAQHAEASIVAQAAKEGISLKGADLYITTFACPVCAKLVSETGIARLFFKDGYAMVDGLRVLEESGIEVVKVVAYI